MAKKKKKGQGGKKTPKKSTPATKPTETKKTQPTAVQLEAAEARAKTAETEKVAAELALKIEKSKGIPSVDKKTGKTEIQYTDVQLMERELRRYVKKSGGFRKGIGPKAIERAEQLLGLLERKEVKWDEAILLKGFTDVLKEL